MRARWLWLGLVAALGTPVLAGDAPPRYSHQKLVDLEPGGPTTVPVTAEMLRGGFDAADWRVVGEDGEALEARLEGDQRGRRAVRLVDVRASREGYLITFDLGAAPPRHDSLRVVMSQPSLARGVLLEQSTDARAWSPLARATLFRLGSASGLIGAEIRYPPIRARYLRLHWPEDAGFPEFKEITTRDLDQSRPPRTLVEMELGRQEPPIEGCTVYVISRGGLSAAAESLELEFAPGKRSGVEAFQAGGGEWSSWGEFELPSSPERRTLALSIPAPGAPEWTMVRACRHDGPASPLESAALAYEPWRLVIDGHGHAWGGIEYGARLPEETLAPLTRLDRPFEGVAWPVRAPGAKAGDVVHAALPGEVLAAVEGRLGRLRLLTVDGWMPLEAYRSGPPEPAGAGLRLERETSQDGKWLEGLKLSLEEGRLWPESAELLLRGVSFEQDVTVEIEEERRLGVEPKRRVLDRRHWSCQYRDLPCRLSLAPPSTAVTGEIQVSFHQGGVPAAVESQVVAWRPGAEIAFVWPGAGKNPRLAAFSSVASPPAASAPPGFGDWVRHSKASKGEVMGGALPSGERPGAFAGWMLYLGLAATAAVLALVIFRALRKREDLSDS